MMVSKRQLVNIVDSSINDLVRTFQKDPYFFYTENDLHCYLYHEIYSKLLPEGWQCRTKDRRLSILLHKEYPTKQRYSAKGLKENVPRGARGHFDLAIWNPEKTEGRVFSAKQSASFEEEQETFVAIELDLIEGNNGLEQAVHHLKWDLLKLRSAENEIEHGYSLVFVRDWIHRDRFLKETRDEVAKEKAIVVLYVEKGEEKELVGSLSQKSFLNYKRLFYDFE
jgi:hypothetical protein